MKPFWQKRKWPLLLLAFAAAGAAIYFFAKPAPPVLHEGKDAWEWARLLESPDPKAREKATAALRAMGPNAVPLLQQRLRERESLLRQARVWLGARLPARVVAALKKNRQPVSYVAVRSTAAYGIKALGTNAASAVPDLIRALHDPSRQVMWYAATALGETGEAGVLPLIPLLDDPDPQVRHATAYALGQIGPPALAAVPSLVQRTGEKNEAIRSSSLYALSRIGSIAGPAVLKLVQESRGEDQRVAVKALVAVRPRGQLTLPVLVKIARDPDAASRAAAIEALGLLYISHTNALTVYFEGLQDSSAAVRLAATKAIEQAARKSAGATNTLAALKENDPDEAVRLAAGVALEKIIVSTAPQSAP